MMNSCKAKKSGGAYEMGPAKWSMFPVTGLMKENPMKRSYVMCLVAGLVAMMVVVAVTGWLTPVAGSASATNLAAVPALAVNDAADPAVEEALEEVIDEVLAEPVAMDAAGLDDPRDDGESYEFVGLHAGTLLCDLSKFNLGLGGLSEPARERDSTDDLVRFELFNAAGNLAATPVPEPMALALLALGSTAALLHPPRRGEW
jgi:hypothetical protein